ncbi:hypothetical protein L208DRAFT_1380154 [Tricholoma matsutake]|nr:hypothetical protein L208DRAFT_1380154 [Tricholoma matsutake 945]
MANIMVLSLPQNSCAPTTPPTTPLPPPAEPTPPCCPSFHTKNSREANHVTTKQQNVLDEIAAALSKIQSGIPTWSPSTATLPNIETILNDAELKIELNCTTIAQLTHQTESLNLHQRKVMNMLEGVEELLGNWRTIVPGTTKYDCNSMSPPNQVIFFLGIWARIKAGISQSGGSGLLGFLSIYGWHLLHIGGAQPTTEQLGALSVIPAKITSLESKVNLQGRTMEYAVCHECHQNYDPSQAEPIYPSHCSNTPDLGAECGA